ncbi:rRNA maturation RNase YbeY [Oscillatoria amoena NRMC-F 0135]|nr:rRNA maturation RNase YbeY [Oscillatoria amoena NRMC-F 0135]
MAQINYFAEGLAFSVPNPRKKANWIKSVVKREGNSISCINFIFCTDAALLKLNKRYLNHTTFTDIITFQHSAAGNPIEGDVFLSIPRIKYNARLYKAEFDHELSRVMIHGVLHLLGYSDKSATQKAKMRQKEDAYLSLR